MELRDFALRALTSRVLNDKLQKVTTPLTDHVPGPALRLDRPSRPDNLQFAARRTAPAMPKGEALRLPEKRAVAHHVMANHELQALEVMAMVMLAFPEAPPEFRMGMARIMQDEQRHTRMHVQRSGELGLTFGELPVNAWIWNKAQEFQSVLEYCCGLPLVFEGANLDHTAEFEQYFRDAGDRRSAAIMRAIHRDEIRHVQFGIEWLRRLKPESASDWDTWLRGLHWPLRPEKARGAAFQTEARRAAGLTDDFIARLANWSEKE